MIQFKSLIFKMKGFGRGRDLLQESRFESQTQQESYGFSRLFYELFRIESLVFKTVIF